MLLWKIIMALLSNSTFIKGVLGALPKVKNSFEVDTSDYLSEMVVLKHGIYLRTLFHTFTNLYATF